jgi:hypothetical protein
MSVSSITHYLEREVIRLMIYASWNEKCRDWKVEATILL